jgi:hypothetical protein
LKVCSLDANFENIPIESKHTNLKYKKFSKGGGAVLLLWANTFSLFVINRQKGRLCEPFLLSIPLVQVNMSANIIPIEEWCGVTAKNK